MSDFRTIETWWTQLPIAISSATHPAHVSRLRDDELDVMRKEGERLIHAAAKERVRRKEEAAKNQLLDGVVKQPQ